MRRLIGLIGLIWHVLSAAFGRVAHEQVEHHQASAPQFPDLRGNSRQDPLGRTAPILT